MEPIHTVSIVEYASIIWSPYIQSLINKLETVQLDLYVMIIIDSHSSIFDSYVAAVRVAHFGMLAT